MSETDNLPKQISNLGITFDNINHFSILIMAHYILIYMMLSYIVYYSIDIILNWRRVVFLPFTILFDLFIPVGFALYVFFRLDKKCNCILSSYDNFYSDLSLFFQWLNKFIPKVWKTLMTFFDWFWQQIKINIIDQFLLEFEEPIKYSIEIFIHIYDYIAPRFEMTTQHIHTFILYIPISAWAIIILMFSIYWWVATRTFALAEKSVSFWIRSLWIFGVSTAIILYTFYALLRPHL